MTDEFTDIAQQAAEGAAARIDWSRATDSLRPPQSWFDDDNPFEPEEMQGI